MNPQYLSRIGQDCACLNARLAARTLTKFYEQCLMPTGLKMTQFSILVAVAAHHTVSITKLAAALDLERTTLTRGLHILERDKLIQIGAEKDARRKKIQITNLGEARLLEALPLWQKAQHTVQNSLNYNNLMEQFRAIRKKELVL